MRRGTMFWGTILVIFGFVMLLSNLGLLGGLDIWELLWPAFLILMGVWVLVGTFFRSTHKIEHVNLALDGAQRGRVRLNHAAGRLSVFAADYPPALVVGDFGGGVQVSSRREGDSLNVTVGMPAMIFPFSWLPGESVDWSVGLNRNVPLALELETGANEANINLSGMKVTDIRLQSGASSTTIQLPEAAGETRLKVNAGAALVRIMVPQGVAARLRAQGGAMGVEVDTARFPHSAGMYQSPDFDTATNRVDIQAEMGAGSVQVS